VLNPLSRKRIRCFIGDCYLANVTLSGGRHILMPRVSLPPVMTKWSRSSRSIRSHPKTRPLPWLDDSGWMGFRNHVAGFNVHNGWSFFGCWTTLVRVMMVLVFSTLAYGERDMKWWSNELYNKFQGWSSRNLFYAIALISIAKQIRELVHSSAKKATHFPT